MRDHNKDAGTFTIDIDSFNNKGQKGDDDFETWLINEAPFKPDESMIGTYAEGSGSYTDDLSQHSTCTSTITGLSPTFTIKDDPHFAVTKQKKLPIDILHKWYPEQMKVDDD